MTPEQYREYERWREKQLLNPDVSIEAFLYQLDAERALEEKLAKENA